MSANTRKTREITESHRFRLIAIARLLGFLEPEQAKSIVRNLPKLPALGQESQQDALLALRDADVLSQKQLEGIKEFSLALAADVSELLPADRPIPTPHFSGPRVLTSPQPAAAIDRHAEDFTQIGAQTGREIRSSGNHPTESDMRQAAAPAPTAFESNPLETLSGPSAAAGSSAAISRATTATQRQSEGEHGSHERRSKPSPQRFSRRRRREAYSDWEESWHSRFIRIFRDTPERVSGVMLDLVFGFIDWFFCNPIKASITAVVCGILLASPLIYLNSSGKMGFRNEARLFARNSEAAQLPGSADLNAIPEQPLQANGVGATQVESASREPATPAPDALATVDAARLAEVLRIPAIIDAPSEVTTSRGSDASTAGDAPPATEVPEPKPIPASKLSEEASRLPDDALAASAGEASRDSEALTAAAAARRSEPENSKIPVVPPPMAVPEIVRTDANSPLANESVAEASPSSAPSLETIRLGEAREATSDQSLLVVQALIDGRDYEGALSKLEMMFSEDSRIADDDPSLGLLPAALLLAQDTEESVSAAGRQLIQMEDFDSALWRLEFATWLLKANPDERSVIESMLWVDGESEESIRVRLHAWIKAREQDWRQAIDALAPLESKACEAGDLIYRSVTYLLSRDYYGASEDLESLNAMIVRDEFSGSQAQRTIEQLCFSLLKARADILSEKLNGLLEKPELSEIQ